ncbi:MAG TPA: sigma-70 family RNA polymerase sigma factor [Solirubrobacteraceae bacterium]|nr:sigma-70 family RNA polymerase sigma factor [Solirubrobacteraceae bacterium]
MHHEAGTSIGAAQQHLDCASRAWLDALRSAGPRREAAIRRLHALLLGEARHEVRRRTAGLQHPSGGDLDDLAVMAADDALVAILAKLEQFRGDALFTTWARRFVVLEVPGKIRRRLGHSRETPTEDEVLQELAGGEDPLASCEARELARGIGSVIASQLTPRQRIVLVALAIDGTPARELAQKMHSSPGALYKTLHDARRKLQAASPAAELAEC